MIKKYEKLIVLFLVLIMSVLSFANLGNRYMFIDESITALLGRNVLEYGYPKVWDGKNLIMAAINGNEFNEKLVYIKHNWLPYYLSALGQLLGDEVFHMRAIFVIIGIIGGIAFYIMAKRLTGSLKIALISLLLYCFSVPIFLYIRSIYYLAPGLTFSILTILFYIEYVDKRKLTYLLAFMVSAVLVFHSLFVFFFVTMTTLITTYVIYDSKAVHQKSFIFGLAGIAACTLPWFIYSNRFLAKVQSGIFLGKIYFFDYLLGYIWMINTYFFPFFSLGIIFLLYFIAVKLKNRKIKTPVKHLDGTPHWVNSNNLMTNRIDKKGKIKSRNRYIIIMQILINLLILSLFGNYLNTRWLIPSIPFFYILIALVIVYIGQHDRFIALTVLCSLIFTNALHISPYLLLQISTVSPERVEKIIKPPVPFFNVDEGWQTMVADLKNYLEQNNQIRSYLLEYIGEISNDYDDAEEGMVKTLKKYGQPSDKVHLVGFQHETIIYYTNMQLVNRLDADRQYLPLSYKTYPNANQYEHLTAYPIEDCDWIVIREYDDKNELRKVQQIIQDSGRFEELYINYPEADPWCEIWAHSFTTENNRQGFLIYRNKETTKALDVRFIDKKILEDQ